MRTVAFGIAADTKSADRKWNVHGERRQKALQVISLAALFTFQAEQGTLNTYTIESPLLPLERRSFKSAGVEYVT